MAALTSISYCLQSKSSSIKEYNSRIPRISSSVLPCHSDEPKSESNSKLKENEKGSLRQSVLLLLDDASKFGKALKESLSPKQKGDWKDLVLMSLSFAVYVYISQKIVCAYCAWMSILKQSW